MRLKEKSGTYKIFNKQNGRQPDFKWLNGKVYLLLLGSIALIGFIIFRDYLVFNKVYLFKRVASDSFDYFTHMYMVLPIISRNMVFPNGHSV